MTIRNEYITMKEVQLLCLVVVILLFGAFLEQQWHDHIWHQGVSAPGVITSVKEETTIRTSVSRYWAHVKFTDRKGEVQDCKHWISLRRASQLNDDLKKGKAVVQTEVFYLPNHPEQCVVRDPKP